jgi:hypothetical protein
MKRALLVVILMGVLLGAFALAPQSALAWGPCNGPYGGYAGCSMGGYSGGYSGGYYGGGYGGYGYNRVCYWAYYWYYPRLVCTYVRVPAYPTSGYYGYGGYGMYGGY